LNALQKHATSTLFKSSKTKIPIKTWRPDDNMTSLRQVKY